MNIMNSGNANSAAFDRGSNRQLSTSSNKESYNTGSGFRSIMQKSRLTEEDLESFRKSILKAHKKKHYKVLMISALLFIGIGILLYFLAF